MPLEHGRTYHIYNRGINSTDIFSCEANYKRFLMLYGEYVSPVADTYAWVLLRNHFHLLVRIKGEEEIPFMRLYPPHPPLSGSRPLTGCEDNTLTVVEDPVSGSSSGKRYTPSKQFSHLFNAYAQYFNKYTGRHGGLLETPFKRIRVDTQEYFRRLVYYIHHNPVKHGFAEHILDWGWSSYLTMLSVKPTNLSRETVLGYFDDVANFKFYHQQQHDLKEIECLLLE